jgi:hypothetical protein
MGDLPQFIASGIIEHQRGVSRMSASALAVTGISSASVLGG